MFEYKLTSLCHDCFGVSLATVCPIHASPHHLGPPVPSTADGRPTNAAPKHCPTAPTGTCDWSNPHCCSHQSPSSYRRTQSIRTVTMCPTIPFATTTIVEASPVVHTNSAVEVPMVRPLLLRHLYLTGLPIYWKPFRWASVCLSMNVNADWMPECLWAKKKRIKYYV